MYICGTEASTNGGGEMKQAHDCFCILSLLSYVPYYFMRRRGTSMQLKRNELSYIQPSYASLNCNSLPLFTMNSMLMCVLFFIISARYGWDDEQYIPQFVPLQLGQAKIPKEQRQAQKFFATNEESQLHPPWGGGGGREFGFLLTCSKATNMCSQACSQQDITLWTISFALSSTLVYQQPKRRRLQYIYFGTVHNLIKSFDDGPIKDTHHKRKKFELWDPHN